MTNQFVYILQIWDVTSGKCLKTLSGHTDYVRTLCILPNGLLASGSEDKKIMVWKEQKTTYYKKKRGGVNWSSMELEHMGM